MSESVRESVTDRQTDVFTKTLSPTLVLTPSLAYSLAVTDRAVWVRPSGTYGEQPRRTMTLAAYLDTWAARAAATPAARASLPLLYLKDWHLARALPAAPTGTAPPPPPFTTPPLFQDDWLNAYWDTRGHDDYRFCYMGPAGAPHPPTQRERDKE
jgi:hypothetical protein